MKLYRTKTAPVVVTETGTAYSLSQTWDELFQRDDLLQYLSKQIETLTPLEKFSATNALAPIQSQEVWAAGVTYYRSRDARMEESKEAGGGSFYDKVYTAERPELFLKATPHRVVGTGGAVRIREDASWNVPEPELTLVLSAGGKIIGYTIGNDMSSRDIEGENPLYLPQAKVYNQCCALGPAIYVSNEMLPKTTEISISIRRGAATMFEGKTTLEELKRKPEELVHFLFRDNSFPNGCFLMTGTGVVPPNSFTLQTNDVVSISIQPIGTLVNTVVQGN